MVSDGRAENQVGASDGSKELLLRSLFKFCQSNKLISNIATLRKKKKKRNIVEKAIDASHLHVIESIHPS